MSDKTATFSLRVEADAKPAASAAGELEALKKAIDSSKSVIEQYSKSLRSLRGNSDEVKSAKAQLKARIDAERDAISRNSLSILKLGTSYEQLSKKTKKAETEAKSFKDVVGQVGGPVADVTSKVGSWEDVLAACSDPMVALGLLLAAAAAAFVVLGAAVVSGTLALAKFVAESANVLRAQGLMREGVLGTEANAKAFGHQIDDLANKLATPKEKLNDLAVSLSKTFVNSRVNGQAIVDTFQAVARASDAMGDEAGRAFQSIIERGKLSGRIGINPLELRQIGIDFGDLAKSIAKSTHVTVDEARRQLLNGIAPVGAAAQALREAAEKRFGTINAKKLLDLNVITAKFKENLAGLTKDVDLTPFLEALKSLADLFSDTTSTGHSLKVFVTGFGNALGAIAKAALPYFIEGTKQAINYGLRFANTLLELTIAIVKWGQSSSGQATLKTTLAIVTFLAETALTTFERFTASLSSGFGGFDAFAKKIAQVALQIRLFFAQDWSAIGMQVVDGLWNGLKAGWASMLAKFHTLVALLPESVRKVLGIQSPSKVFANLGKQTSAGFAQGITSTAGDAQDAVAGFAQGITATADDAQDAVVAMAAPPAPSAATGGGGSAGASHPPVTLNIVINGADAQKTAAILKSEGVLDMLTRAVEIANRGLGVPTQQAAGA